MGKASKVLEERRRRDAWHLCRVEGYTQGEIAERLGVSARTVRRYLKYFKDHPEEMPVPHGRDFAADNQFDLSRLLHSGRLTPWQEAQIRRDIYRSQVTREEEQKGEKKIIIEKPWGPEDEDNK